MKLKEINVMKRICLLFLLTVAITSAFAQSEEARQRQWDSYGYGQFYVVSYLYSGPSILDYDEYEDNTWKGYESQWESGDYVFLKKCEYYTRSIPISGMDAVLFNKKGSAAGLCMGNTLIDLKTPISDDFEIPSMPDINLFFVDLDFIIRQKNHLNSLTIPNMIRGVYSSSGDKLYVDTLYVEGDYECMVNNKLKGNSVLGNNWESEFIYNKIGYCDDWSPVEYAIEGKEPVLIAKTVIYEGEPIKSYTKRGKGVGFGNEETYLNYLMANQWGDQIESVELTDRSLRGIASNAFSGSKTLKRVKITFPEWSGEFEYEPIGTFLPGIGFEDIPGLGTRIDEFPVIRIGSKAFYGCENLEVCDFGDDSVTVYDKTGIKLPNSFYFGDSAFAYCTKLDTFRCKNQHMFRAIGKYMFLGCKNLRYFSGEDAFVVGEGAFDGCENLSGHISIPNAKVGAKAFQNCVNIESIDMEAHNVGEIGSTESFKGCKKLEYINVNNPYSNETCVVEKSVFQGCVNLKGISIKSQGHDIPFRIRMVDTCAFKDCRSLEADIVTCSEPYELYRKYVSSDGEDPMVVFDSAFVGSGIKSVTLSYVNAANAFDDCANLESATFWGPDEGRNTFVLPDFRDCPKLKKIVVNGGGWDLEAQVTLKDEQTVKVIDNLDGLYLLGKPHIYVGDYPNYNFANTILYVPKGMKNVYRENALAPTFKDIVELTDEQVGIIKVTMDGAAENGNGDAAVYDLSGQRVLKTIPGNVYVSKGRKFIAK